MESLKLAHVLFDTAWDLEKRINLVMSLHKSLGYVNRKELIYAYGITQQQAGLLMRDFIHVHAKNIRWDMTHARYSLKIS